MKKLIKILNCKIFTINDLNHKIFAEDDLGTQKHATLLKIHGAEGAFFFFWKQMMRNKLFSFIALFSWKSNRGLGFLFECF